MRALQRHRRIAGQHVIERAHVGGALDIRVSAQRRHSTPGRPTLPSTSCRMHSDRICCTVRRLIELQRAAKSCLVFRTRGGAEHVRYLLELGPGNPADALDHVRRVAAVGLCRCGTPYSDPAASCRGVSLLIELISPGRFVVDPLVGIESAEQPVQIRRCLEARVHQEGAVGVMGDVVVAFRCRARWRS